MANTYTDRQLPPTHFRVCYTTLNAFRNVVKYVVLQNVKYTLVFQLTMLLRCLKQYLFHISISEKSLKC